MTKFSKNAAVANKFKMWIMFIVFFLFLIAVVHIQNISDTNCFLQSSNLIQNAEPVTEYQKCISKLPEWVRTNSAFDIFAAEMIKGSKGLSDKTQIKHKYQYMYQRYLAGFPQRVSCEKKRTSNKIRILEI